MKLYVIFDAPPGPESGRFVEVEDEKGQSHGPQTTGAEWEQYDGMYPQPTAEWRVGDPAFWRLGPFVPASVADRLAAAREYVRHRDDCDCLSIAFKGLHCSCGLSKIWGGEIEDD